MSDNSKNLRSPRFDQLVQTLELRAEIDQQSCDLHNISETGLAAAFSGNPPKVGQIIPTMVTLPSGQILYKGDGQIVWKNKREDKTIIGLEFKSHLISRDLIKGLDIGEVLLETVDDSQKQFESIPQDFKILVYEIKNYMKNLKNQIDEIERRMKIESLESNASLLRAFEMKVGPAVTERLLNFSKRLVNYTDLLRSLSQKKTVTDFFRSELNDFYLTSPYASRAQLKPLGYAGDYEMMNQLYRNTYEGISLFSKIIHAYTVNEVAGKSVRLRRIKLKDEISQVVASRVESNITNIACGPAQEVVDFIHDFDPSSGKRVTITLIDQDAEALVYAKRNVREELLKRSLPIEVHFLNISVRDILEQSSNSEPFKRQNYDLIYSAGLFDYLTDSVARLMITEAIQSLRPRGKILIGNFHPNNPTRGISEFAIDWKLIHRNEEQMLNLAPPTKNIIKKVSLDELGIVVFLELLKMTE